MGRSRSKRRAHAPRSAGELVRDGLRSTFEEVREHLPLAAHHADEDGEHVHQLRVAARRGLTFVRIAAELLRPRDRRRLRRWLRKIRKAAGEARDLDVLLLQHDGARTDTAGLGERALLVETRERRRAAQLPIEALHARLAADERWPERERRILRRALRRGRGVRARPWAVARLGDVFERFVAATPADLSDIAALHRYRIRAKDLRYALEELAPALPRRLVRELQPIVTELQDRLGEVNDHAVLALRFRARVEASVDPVLAAHLASLAEREAHARSLGVDALVAWWRPLTEARFLTTFAVGLERAAPR
jgi:CHAD domain-containing protein